MSSFIYPPKSRHEPLISPYQLSLSTHFCYRHFDLVGNEGIQWSLITSVDAIQIVRAASGNLPILLLVDETMQLGKVNATAVLAEIGELLDEFNDLHCVVSTLDQLFFNHVATTSGRMTNWIELTSPDMFSCLILLWFTDTNALTPIVQCTLECCGRWGGFWLSGARWMRIARDRSVS